ncbi:MAG: type II toxin-antitoxin system VapC family toxin [Bryobacteraceae bacterium]
MEWIEALRGSTVGVDTGPLIYYIEEEPAFLTRIKLFFEAAERGEFRIVTSFVTLIEVLIHPLREGRPELADEYRDILLHSAALTAVPLDEGVAESAAQLRARHNLRTPDAIQLATAISSGASWFLTNDAGLADLPEISVLLLKRLPLPT